MESTKAMERHIRLVGFFQRTRQWSCTKMYLVSALELYTLGESHRDMKRE